MSEYSEIVAAIDAHEREIAKHKKQIHYLKRRLYRLQSFDKQIGIPFDDEAYDDLLDFICYFKQKYCNVDDSY